MELHRIRAAVRVRTQNSCGDLTRLGLAVAVVGSIALQGCVIVGVDYERPEVNTPDVWTSSLRKDLHRRSNLAKWWKSYNDPALNRLIEKTQAANPNLKAASQAISIARSQRGVATSLALPSANGDASFSRNRSSQSLFVPGPVPNPSDLYVAGFDAGWEIDIFGGLRRNIEAADANLEASIELYRDTLVTLFSETALNYIEYRTLEERIRLAIANANSQQESVDLTEARLDAGLAPKIDVTQARTNLETTRSIIPQLKIQLAETRNRLASLTAQDPAAVTSILRHSRGIPSPPRGYSAGMPCDLIRARPDIRAAERQLAAQTALIGVAEADLYPRFTLFGDFSLQTITTSNFWNTSAGAYSFGPAIQWQIFSAGRIRNNIRIEEATTEQALANYENTVLLAVEEVENSMSAIANGWDLVAILGRADSAARETVELVKDNYQNGLVDFQRVLDAERTKFTTEDDLAVARGTISQSYVALYKALGGGSEVELIPVPEASVKALGGPLKVSQRRAYEPGDIEPTTDSNE
ncbi:MAG: efflux transporter outer membrane subunit [Verrucomicrobiota bacterium]